MSPQVAIKKYPEDRIPPGPEALANILSEVPRQRDPLGADGSGYLRSYLRLHRVVGQTVTAAVYYSSIVSRNQSWHLGALGRFRG